MGEAREWIPDLLAMAQDLKTGAGHLPGVDVGPLISPAAKTYVEDVIDSAVADGCNLLLDGRNTVVPGYESGNFVGPTIITGAQTHMSYGLRKFSRSVENKLDIWNVKS